MAEAIMEFPVTTIPHFHSSSLHPANSITIAVPLRQRSNAQFSNGWQCQVGSRKSRRGCLSKVKAFPDWPLMAVLVQHIEGQRDVIIHKSVWHLNDEAIKNVYTFYIMFTCWGCCFFGSTKDPYYDSEVYRKDGGDGSGNWLYEKQDDIEESARAALWREELIEEIEQKATGAGLPELEEAGRK
ncbi:hypothetical protein Nepgr_023770 [Nepenthes gracilis]|uniref:Photosynthetic NDH subcomplex B 4 n=1 Tax=Nepenthes gracilis TaxID=150966 RepID=A0AAD3XY00_NEPGR|nr:hypothetical protein Nepgr_023770 [Nepenthes gracilis]